jgi:hypothetical protein
MRRPLAGGVARGLAAPLAALLVLLGSAGCSGGDPGATAPDPTGSAVSQQAAAQGACVTALHADQCGPYDDDAITNSNGSNTYVANNMWGCGPDGDSTCGPQTLISHDAGRWSVRSNQQRGNTAVRSYPNVQQLFNDWTGAGWDDGTEMTDTPVSKLTALTSSYAESMPRDGTGTIAQAAWDIWLSGTKGPTEIMVWVDNVGRGSGGADQRATATIHGQDWTLYQYGDDELIWSLGPPGTFRQQAAGTVDLLALLRWLVDHGYVSKGAMIGQIDFGWEICSTGGSPQTFQVHSYALTAHIA